MIINFNNYEPNEIIRFIREYTGLTQKEFGKSINKSERTIIPINIPPAIIKRWQKMVINFNNYEPNEVMRFIREYTGLTQKEFGKSIGKSERTIQDYEAGYRRYSVDTLKNICNIYNIDITITNKKEK